MISWFEKLLSLPFTRKSHHQFLKQHYSFCPTVADIDVYWLKNCQIKGIIIDLDNTIISEDDRYISPHAEEWIQKAKIAGFKFFILSNGKRRHRVIYWANRLGIPALSPAKKPFPGAFKHALSVMKLHPQEVITIGDSFHTDVMGAKIIGSHCIQVATLPHPPRWWETIAGRWLQKPYSQSSELWLFEASKYSL